MNVRLKHNMLFTAGIYYGGEMRMNHYTLTLYMLTNSQDAVSHNVAFERIKYFVYNCLDSTVFINQDNDNQCKKFLESGITVTTLPGEPVDQLVGLMLYYKLNAIMEDRILVEETEISSILGESIIYLHGEHEHTDVPLIPDWWTTSDIVHGDYVSLPADKIVNMQGKNIWKDLDLNWPELNDKIETGNIVVFADFKNNETK